MSIFLSFRPCCHGVLPHTFWHIHLPWDSSPIRVPPPPFLWHIFCHEIPLPPGFLPLLLLAPHLPFICLSSSFQVAVAPLDTQACTLDIEKFHCTCSVLPDHKPWLIVQGQSGEFYIDHAHSFSASCTSRNAGMIVNAVVNIWTATGVKPILKYKDDLNIFRFPVADGPFVDGKYCLLI